jgi:hypothetical protein
MRHEACYYDLATKVVSLVVDLKAMCRGAGGNRNWNATIPGLFRDGNYESRLVDWIWRDVHDLPENLYDRKDPLFERKVREMLDDNKDLLAECVLLGSQAIRED